MQINLGHTVGAGKILRKVVQRTSRTVVSQKEIARTSRHFNSIILKFVHAAIECCCL